MKLTEWQEALIKTSVYDNSFRSIREDAVGGGAQTTSANVAYIPTDVPPVHKELTRLSKKKKNWNISVLESSHEYIVSFEDYSNIVVPVSLWENFKTTIFGTSNLPDGEFTVDLGGYLVEALNDEIDQSLYQLRAVIVQFLNSDMVSSQRHKVASFERVSGLHTNFANEGRSAITGVNSEQQLSKFLQLVQNTYKNDVGSIQLIASAIQQRSPLTEIPLFDQYDNLMSVVLSNDSFSYTSIIDLDFTIQESLVFQGMVPRGLSGGAFKVQGNKVYPTSPKGFPSNISDYLKGV